MNDDDDIRKMMMTVIAPTGAITVIIIFVPAERRPLWGTGIPHGSPLGPVP